MMAHAGKTLSQQAVAALSMRPAARPKTPHMLTGGVVRGKQLIFKLKIRLRTAKNRRFVPQSAPHLRTSGRRARKPHQPWKNGWKHRGFLIGSPSRCRTDATGRANAAGLTRPRLPRRPACRASNASKLCNASTMRTRWARKRPARHGMPFASGPCWPGCTHAEGRGRNGRLQGGPALRGLADGRRAAGHGEGLSCQQHAEP